MKAQNTSNGAPFFLPDPFILYFKASSLYKSDKYTIPPIKEHSTIFHFILTFYMQKNQKINETLIL